MAGLGVAICLLLRGMPGRAMGLIFILPLLFWPAEEIPPGEARIDVLDVGQGQFVVVRTRSQVLVFDPGPRYNAEVVDAGQRVLLPFLRWLKVDRIDVLIVTHDEDSDHAGGLASLLASMPAAVARILASTALDKAANCADEAPWEVDGVSFTLRIRVRWTQERSLATIFPACWGSARRRASGLADGGYRGCCRIGTLCVGMLPPCGQMLAPHHGSATSSTEAFIAAVNARDVLFSVGYRNRFGHPQGQVLARYAASGARLWRTDQDGMLRVSLQAGGAEVVGWRTQGVVTGTDGDTFHGGGRET